MITSCALVVTLKELRAPRDSTPQMVHLALHALLDNSVHLACPPQTVQLVMNLPLEAN